MVEREGGEGGARGAESTAQSSGTRGWAVLSFWPEPLEGWCCVPVGAVGCTGAEGRASSGSGLLGQRAPWASEGHCRISIWL